MNQTKKLVTLLLLLSCFAIAESSFGLVSRDQKPLELLDIETQAVIEGPYAEIQYIQTYKNPTLFSLETEYFFPRTEDSVFYKFEAIFKNKTIVGRIMEKEKAKEAYEWNRKRGNTVAYAEKSKATPDVMQIKVGNIPPMESVQIRFSIIQPLEVIVNKYWGFTLPSVLTERYAPASTSNLDLPKIQNVGEAGSNYRNWKVSVEIRSQTPFKFAKNPSHKFEPTLRHLKSGSSPIYVASWNVTILPNKNFVVYFQPTEIETPQIIQAAHPENSNDQVLLLNFIPELNSAEISSGLEDIAMLRRMILENDIERARGEFIFVIDRSGSMDGERIRNLKRALLKFFENLPRNSFFNIVSFGSQASMYKSHSVRYSPESLEEVQRWITTIDADMGGTEILSALRTASFLPILEGYPRTVLLLTDGDVFNPDEIIRHVLDNSKKTRVCSVGIGHGASEYLVKNVAKAGKCTSEFVFDSEDIGEKVLYMIKAAISQYLEDIRFKIECFDENEKLVFTQEDKTDILLKDMPFKKWILFPDTSSFAFCKARVDYYSSYKDQKFFKEFEIRDFKLVEVTETWHRVAYDSKIKELDLQIKSGQDRQKLEQEIVGLSLKYQVLSEYTSFLAVLQENSLSSQTNSQKVHIPNLDSADHTSTKCQENDSDLLADESYQYDYQVTKPQWQQAPQGSSATIQATFVPILLIFSWFILFHWL